MSKYVVTEASNWDVESGTAVSVSVTGTDNNVKIEGNSVYAGTITATVSGYNGNGITNSDGIGTGSISGNSIYCKSSVGNLVLDDIKIPVIVSGTTGTPPTTTPVGPITVNVVVKNVNQNVVQAE